MDILQNIKRTFCWKCNGRGKIEIDYISDEDLSFQKQTINCPICGGTGYIEIPIKQMKIKGNKR